MRRDLGDFPTPPGLVAAVLVRLDALAIPRDRLLEPTCGSGGFLLGVRDRVIPTVEAIGLEIQPGHVEAARARFGSDHRVRVEWADVFAVDLGRLGWKSSGPLLVVGNPPWVTAAELGRLGSGNGPTRSPVAGMSGIEARTGRANFDLAEAVWLKLIRELRDTEPDATIALLCKAATARAVFRAAASERLPVASASFYRIDARLWFDVAVDAGLLVVRLGGPPVGERLAIYPGLGSDQAVSHVGLDDGQLVADADAFARSAGIRARGRTARPWRQGVKHDAAAVVELTWRDRAWRNRSDEPVDVEPEAVYPLRKAADLARPESDRPARSLIVTQRSLNDDPTRLAETSPRLWAYLQAHAGIFRARRSRIYRGRPAFSIFGVGAYTFAPWKVAVSGLHRPPRFRPVGPVDGRPVVFDDVSYFLPCDGPDEADSLARRLEGPDARDLIAAFSFPDAKRAVTGAILNRLDLDRLLPLATNASVE